MDPRDQINQALQQLEQAAYQKGLVKGIDIAQKIITWLNPQSPVEDWEDYTKMVRQWAENELRRTK